MIMHHGLSGLSSSVDLFLGNPMVKHQSDLHTYQPYDDSDSSRSSSLCSSSPSPHTSSSTVATKTPTSTATTTTTTPPSAASAAPIATGTTALNDIDPQLAQHVEYELGLSKKNGSGTRKNAWGNLSYAELISKAITTSAEQRLTLSEIYDWMIKYVPFFRNKVDRVSSAGWKNSIRHNLSLHNRFKRIQSEGTGKSSWWIINPDEKSSSPNSANDSSSSSNGIKQPRRRLGQTPKSTSTAPKRLRGPRANLKTARLAANNHRQQESSNHPMTSADLSSIPVYDNQQWSTQLDSDSTINHLYDHDLYVTSVHTPIANNNSTGGLPSTYPFDDLAPNYVSNTSSHPTNPSDYSYHHPPHHFHSHQPSHTLYQHHHGSNYETGSTNGYYQQQPVLNDHHLLPMDTYHNTNGLNYSLQQQQQQQQQQQLDPNDDQHTYLRVHSTSSHSSSSSLSPPMLTTTTNNLPSSSSSASSSSSYSYPHKNLNSSTGGYHHSNSNGTLTLYSHHHHQHSADIETLLHLNGMDEEDDDDDLLTLVHHHDGMIDDQQQLASFFPSNNHPLFSHNEPSSSSSILRTVLKRPIVDMHNQ